MDPFIMLHPSILSRLAALAMSLAFSASPVLAANLQELGDSKTNPGKVYLDLDSVRPVGDLRVASLVTIYPEPSVNPHGFLLDRHVQVDGFDCAGRRIVGIRTIGYLNGKDVASGPELADWRTKLRPLPDDAMSARALDLVCSAAAGSGATVGPQIGFAPTIPPPPAVNRPRLSSGSGIFVNTAGFVLTNAHVAGGCKTLAVKAFGAPTVVASLEAVDPTNDLALLRTAAGYGVPAEFRSESKPARLGEDIGVVGYPLPGILSTEPKATFGQVNSVAGMNNDYTRLQISAPVQPGNSGGPVLDVSGLVVGVVVSQASLALVTKIGSVPQNVNFAIRGELAQIFMTAHGVEFSQGSSWRRLRTDEIAALGERSAAQILCLR